MSPPTPIAIVGSPDWSRQLRATLRYLPTVQSTSFPSVDRLAESDDRFAVVLVPTLAMLEQVSRRGFPTFMTEPVRAPLEELQHVLEQSSEWEGEWALGGYARYRPDCRVLLQALGDGKLGEPGVLRVHQWNENGSAVEAGCCLSLLDLVVAVFGDIPQRVFATSAAEGSQLHIHLGFDSGGMAMIDVVQSLPSGCRYDSISLIGSNGACHSDDQHNAQLLFAPNGLRAVVTPVGDGLLQEIRWFLDRMGHPDECARRLAHTRRLIELASAIEQSAQARCAWRRCGGRYEPA